MDCFQSHSQKTATFSGPIMRKKIGNLWSSIYFQKHCTKNKFEKQYFAPQDIKAWWWRLTKTVGKNFL